MNYSIQLPPISTINFTDGNEVAAYGHLALNLLQSFNLTVGDGRTVQSSSELLKSAREWIVSFEKYAEQITAGQLIPAVGYFDILHRFAYSRPASGEFIGKCCMRAFSERVKGNADISETDLFRAISERIRLNDHSFFDRTLLWCGMTIEKWVNECRADGSFHNTPLHIALLQADNVIASDLFAFTGNSQQTFKQKIAIRYLPITMTSVGDDGATLGAKLTFLRNNRHKFAYTIAKTSDLSNINNNTYDTERSLLISLSHSTDIHPLDRQAYLLEADLLTTLAQAI